MSRFLIYKNLLKKMNLNLIVYKQFFHLMTF